MARLTTCLVLRDCLQILNEKRLAGGTWAFDAIHPDLRTGAGYQLRAKPKRFTLEKEGNPSRWITLTALRILKRVDEAI